MRSTLFQFFALVWATASSTPLGTPVSSIKGCLLSAVGGNTDLVAFQGQLFYQAVDVRPYNLNFPVTPAAVTFPETAEQVAAIVKCAADGGYKVQARSGGHSYGNYGLGGTDGAIVIDVNNLKHFSMDYSNYVATVGSGTHLGDLDKRLHNAGNRATTHGTCPQIGIGGHATIGGLGPTARQFGMALDHVLEAEVVLANGSIVTASETQHEDIFWAIRGAGASFGIVTEFKIRTEPEPEPGHAVQYSYTFALGDTASRAKLFLDWQDFVGNPDLSRKFSSLVIVLPGSIIISGTFFGTRQEFDAFELESHFPGSNSSNVIIFQDWLGLLGSWAEQAVLYIGGGIPAAFYSKSASISRKTLIPPSGVHDLFHYLDTASPDGSIWVLLFDLEGGAVNDIPVNATSYAHRDTLFWLQSYVIGIGHVSSRAIGFLDGINDVISASLQGKTDSKTGAYPGIVDPLLPDAQAAYWGSNLERLEAIKAAVDPDDVFHNPQSVRPAL